MKSNLLFATLTLLSTTSFAQMRVGSNAAAAEMLHVEGAILIGTTSTNNFGSIRWTGSDFEGRTTTGWVSLTGDNLPATNVTVTPTADLLADDVQEALEELQAEILATQPSIADVLGYGDDANQGQQLNIDRVSALDGDGLLLTDDAGDGLFVEDGGNVGIGTATPNNLLHVFEQTSGGELTLGKFELLPSSGVGTTAGISIEGQRGNPTNDYAFLDFENNSNDNVIRLGANSAGGGELKFLLDNGTSLVERLTLANDGALTINNEFTLPTTDGTSGQVLTTDGSGNTTWETSPVAAFTTMQGGKADIGGSGSDEIVTLTVTFSNAFASTPNVICTASAQPGTNFDDSFNVTTRNVSTTGFTMVVNRVDGSTWGQALDVHWFAFQ